MDLVDLTIRPAVISDDPHRVFDLLSQLAPDDPRPDPDGVATVWRDILRQAGRRLLLAEADSVLVGTVDTLVVPNLTHDARPHMLIENVVVDAGRRRQGIAAALMAAAVELARSHGCYKVQLLTNRSRTGAQAFYERIGFTRSAIGYRRYL